MPANRYYLDAPFKKGAMHTLAQSEQRHLKKVMRAKEGTKLELVNGRGQLAIGSLVGEEVRLEKVSEEKTPEPLILCQALPRANRLDSIVEKGTELGMTELWLFPGELSEKKGANLARLEAITIAAMKQCGRLDLPKVVIKEPLLKWDKLPYPAFFGDVEQRASVFECDEKSLLFFVGPEAGFSEKEEKHLRQLGAKGVKLHPYILRTDTAPLVALSLIQLARMKHHP